MNKETLLQEHASFKKKLITFSILEGVSIAIILFISILYTILVASLSISFDELLVNETEFGFAIMGFTIFYCIVLINAAIASEVFVPFIVINAIKMGNRNKALRKLERENTNHG